MYQNFNYYIFDCSIELWDTNTATLVKTLTFVWILFDVQIDCSAYEFAFNQKGLLASAYSDSTIKLWNTDSGTVVKTLKGSTGVINSVAFNLNGLLASGSSDMTIKMWNSDTGSLVKTLTGLS